MIARLSALGDVAMTIPVVYGLCRRYPDTRFIFITKPHNARCFVNHPDNLHILPVDFSSYSGIGGLVRLASELRAKYHPELFVDLHDVLRTKIMRICMRAAGVSVVAIDKGRREKKALTRRRNKIMLPLITTVERYENTFKSAGFDVANDFRSVYGQKKGDVALFASVASPPGESDIWIAIAPFARHRGKIYPLSLMKEVVRNLAAEPGYRVFVFGFGDEERKQIDDMAEGMPSVVNMARLAVGLEAEMSILSHCRVMLSMDSANQHLAALAGTRVISVWGATHPYCGFLAWNQREEDCIQLDMTCRPCSVFGDRPCLRDDYHCLAAICPRTLISKIREAAGYGVSHD